MSLLHLDNLSLTIHGTPILRDVTLSMRRGEILAITGESGSGKSMTAFSIMQLLPEGAQATGAIHLGGQDLLQLEEPALCALRGNEVGMVFQEPMTALNPVQTIGQQVAETILIHRDSLRASGRDAMTPEMAEERARVVLTRVGLPPDRFPLSRFPHELSGGQRQRVVIAMAIALRPKLLIADEPTTALDVTTQAQILDLLKGLVKDYGMGLLMITHDLAVVHDLADRIAVMTRGEIVEEGNTRAVMARMEHPYTRALMKASAHQADLPPANTQHEPIIEIRDAVRAYPLPRKRLFQPRDFFRAVDGVSLTLHQGERVGLVGESGCGKSTLTRALLGLEPLQSGEIRLFGQPVSPAMPNALRAGVQVVFQDPYGSFNPRHRVARLISEPFHLMPNPPQGDGRRARVAEVLDAVGLPADAADRYIHEFSGGQRQRIAIARALITHPEMIVFDEAVSALDVRVRAQILDLLAQLARDTGLGYLFISHDLSVVRSVTDRVIVMQSGKIVEDGPTRQVLRAPQHPYTQTLLQAAPTLPDKLLLGLGRAASGPAEMLGAE